MITEDYVSFEVSKLLKEKGFDESINCFYNINGNFIDNTAYTKNSYTNYYAAPTLQMALKWLREVHNLCIEPYRTAAGYLYTISNIPYGSYKVSSQYDCDDEYSGQYTTYEKAVDSAIKYCLTNLIK